VTVRCDAGEDGEAPEGEQVVGGETGPWLAHCVVFPMHHPPSSGFAFDRVRSAPWTCGVSIGVPQKQIIVDPVGCVRNVGDWLERLAHDDDILILAYFQPTLLNQE
jgi:hypothetical protein